MSSHERRIFVDGVAKDEIGLERNLSLEDSHYLKNVLRCQVGDPVILVDRQHSIEFEAFINSIDNPNISVKVSSFRNRTEYLSKVSVVLCALCKQGANEVIVEKATELGVANIWFFQADRSVVRVPSEKEREKKAERLKKITDSAVRQAARISSPNILVINSLTDALLLISAKFASSDKYVAALLPQSVSIFASTANKTDKMPVQSVVLTVGPEGDFSPQEYKLLLEDSFLPISLGGNRLRAETAVIAAIAGFDAVLERNE